MTIKEIEEGDKLITEFMGEVILAANSETIPRSSYVKEFKKFSICSDFCDEVNKNAKKKYFPIHHRGEMEYHSSWDWLMPVVEKIETMNAEVTIRLDSCSIKQSFKQPKVFAISRLSESKIEARWLAIIEFIKWYNQNKSKP